MRERAPDGVWGLAASKNAATRQTDFAIRTGLRMLAFFLQKDDGASQLMLDSIREFVDDLEPLALYDADEQAIDRVLEVLTEWLAARTSTLSHAPGAGSEELLLITRLTVARGTLSAVMKLAALLDDTATPSTALQASEDSVSSSRNSSSGGGGRLSLSAEVLAEIQHISAVEQFEPSTQVSTRLILHPLFDTNIQQVCFHARNCQSSTMHAQLVRDSTRRSMIIASVIILEWPQLQLPS